jgi:methanogenic corrinoid protein MtbC1
MNNSKDPTEPRHPIQVVARRTGLTADVLRAWERRYNAIEPRRSSKNRRLYSDSDIARLQLLRRVTAAGRRIGDVSHLSAAELEALVREDEAASVTLQKTERRPTGGAGEHFEVCMDAAIRLDADALELALSNAAVSLSPPALVEEVLQPLMVEIGNRWRSGDIRIFHEHMSTAVVRSFLATLKTGLMNGDSPVHLIVTTPAGQQHELGAMVVAVTAAMDDWRVTYLGPNLPTEEIAAAAKEKEAQAVALSLVYPTDDPRVDTELRKLRRLLGKNVALIVGGEAAGAYQSVLAEIGAIIPSDLGSLRAELEKLRHAS